MRCRVSDDYGNNRDVWFYIDCDDYVMPNITPQYTMNQASDAVTQEEDLVLTLTRPEYVDGLSYSAWLYSGDDEDNYQASADYDWANGTLTFQELEVDEGDYTLLVRATARDCEDAEARSAVTVVAPTVILESNHPYEEEDGKTWEYSHPDDADYLKVTFSKKTDVDAFFTIFDGNGEARRHTGVFGYDLYSGKTIILPGNSFTLRLDFEDCYRDSYGFKIIRVEAMSQAEYEEYIQSNRFATRELDDGTLEITGYNGVEKSVVIPETLNGKTVTSIGYQAFAGRSDLTSVTLPNTITRIGNDAFAYCSGLTSFTIPGSVKELGEYALAFCTGITAIDLPESIEKLEPDCLRGTGLTSVVVPSKVTNLDDSVFSECYQLASVTLPSGLTRIGDATFHYCSFESIDIPSGVTEIASGAFQGCENLTSLVIPEGVTKLDGQTFQDCDSLESLTIPASLTSMDDSDIGYCDTEKLVIYGKAGSYAQSCAEQYGFQFVAND